MGARAVEIAASDLRQLKQQLVLMPEVVSAAQLGSLLRVLIKKSVADPIAYLRRQSCIQSSDQLHSVRPSLEDVFVTCTGKGRL